MSSLIFNSSIRSVEISHSSSTPMLHDEIGAKTFGRGILLSIKGPRDAIRSLQDCSARLAEEFR
jgi:hypothetical protein